MEVKLLSTTWRVNCQLQAPAVLSPGKKFFFLLSGQYGNDTKAGLSVMQEGRDNCPCREPKHGRPAHIWNIPDRDIMTAAMRGEGGDIVTENAPAVLSNI